MDADGEVKNIDDATRTVIEGKITNYAQNALRTIAIAYRDVQQGEFGEKHDEETKAEKDKDAET